jgi:hypothetical protein
MSEGSLNKVIKKYSPIKHIPVSICGNINLVFVQDNDNPLGRCHEDLRIDLFLNQHFLCISWVVKKEKCSCNCKKGN